MLRFLYFFPLWPKTPCYVCYEMLRFLHFFPSLAQGSRVTFVMDLPTFGGRALGRVNFPARSDKYGTEVFRHRVQR